jgi:hypothetical protein
VDLLPAELKGRYAAERLLGEGGFGRVVLARDLELARTVAIKVLSEELGDEEVRARFLREARVTAQVVHPHVVRVFGHGITDRGVPYIVYEQVEGTDLAALARRPLALERVQRWARELAGALAAAHAQEVVHRDVKPGNVLVRTVDDASVLCDFGLARLAEGRTMLTAEGVLVGTPVFMAPELWKGQPPTPASDQFAWAVTVLAVLGLPTVYGSEDWREIFRLVEQYRPPDLEELRGRDPLLAGVLRRALSGSPEERFPDMASVEAALEGEEMGRTASRPALARLRPGPASGSPPAPPRRRSRLLQAAALVALSLLGGALWPTAEVPGGEGARGPGGRDSERAGAAEWAQVELARDDVLRLLGRTEPPDPWDLGFDSDSTWAVAEKLADIRMPLKLRRLVEAVLAFEAVVHAAGGFLVTVPGAGGAVDDPEGRRLRVAGIFARHLLAMYGHAGDAAMLNYSSNPGQGGVAALAGRLNERREEARELVREVVEATPPELGPDRLPLASMRIRLGQDARSDRLLAWVRAIPELVTPATPPAQVADAFAVTCEAFDGVPRSMVEHCGLRDELAAWRLDRVLGRLEGPGWVEACASLGMLRWEELRLTATCPEAADAPRRYELLLTATEGCVPRRGGDPQLLMEDRLLETVRGSPRGPKVDLDGWTRRSREAKLAGQRLRHGRDAAR